MYSITCAGCFMEFGMPDHMNKARRNDHKVFYCPSGCENYYNAQSAEEKLRQERDNLKQQMARIEEEKRDAMATANQQRELAKKAEAKLKRAKKRHDAGVCQHCNRTVSQMARHVKTCHPEALKPKLVAEKVA